MQYVDLSSVRDPAPTQWLVDRFIPEGSIVTISADGGHGQSLLALWLAACILTERPFLGRTTKPARIVYLDWELDASVQAHRWWSIARGMGLAEPPPGLIYHRVNGPLAGTLDELYQFIAYKAPALFIVDSVRAAVMRDLDDLLKLVAAYYTASSSVTLLCLDYENDAVAFPYTPRWAQHYWHLKRTGRYDNAIRLALRRKNPILSPLEPTIYATLVLHDDSIRLEPTQQSYRNPPALPHIIIDLLQKKPSTANELIQAIPHYGPASIYNALTKLKQRGIITVVGRIGRPSIYALSSSTLDQPERPTAQFADSNRSDR